VASDQCFTASREFGREFGDRLCVAAFGRRAFCEEALHSGMRSSGFHEHYWKALPHDEAWPASPASLSATHNLSQYYRNVIACPDSVCAAVSDTGANGLGAAAGQ